MNNHSLKQLQHYLQEIEKDSDQDSLVSAISEYLFSHQELLADDNCTLELINALSNYLDGNTQSTTEIYTSLYFFWLTCIAKARVDVYYFGDAERVKYFATKLKTPNINNFYFLSSTEERDNEIDAFFAKINDSAAPFVIYDPSGLKTAMRAVNQKIISTISLYDLFNINAIPSSQVANILAYYLSSQYRLLNNVEIKTVIIGNSYGFYGFPGSILGPSVSISIHSLGIKQARQLAEHILTHYPHIENFIFCLGFFDLYSDLFKSNDPYNKHSIDAFSQLTCHHGIKCINDSAIDGALVFSRLVMQAPQQNAITGINEIDALNQVYNESQQVLNNTDSPEAEQQASMAKERAISHSNSVKHKQTFAENQLSADKIAVTLEQSQKKQIWLTPPFPASYVENVVPEMVSSHRDFFARYNTDRATFIDLSEDLDFKVQDFRDGDHLNFVGACKMIVKLRKLNIPL